MSQFVVCLETKFICCMLTRIYAAVPETCVKIENLEHACVCIYIYIFCVKSVYSCMFSIMAFL